MPAGAPLADPSTAVLPAGCSYAATAVSCSGNNLTVKGYDFSLHGGLRLTITGAGNIVTGNKFAVAPNCADPLLRYSVTGGSSILIANNTFDGGGPACTSFVFGTSLFGQSAAGSSITIEYNYFLNIPDDVSDVAGPAAGAASFIFDYNLFDNDGWRAHPDGSQFNGGNFDPIQIEFNTFVTNYSVTGYQTQPFHVEAQLTAALSNSVVAYNTMAAIGACQGGKNYPVGCSANFMIACKQDPGSNSTIKFAAFGNYIDATGAIAALSNAYGCPSTTWGAPIPNYDLTTGLPLPVP